MYSSIYMHRQIASDSGGLGISIGMIVLIGRKKVVPFHLTHQCLKMDVTNGLCTFSVSDLLLYLGLNHTDINIQFIVLYCVYMTSI